MLQKRKTFKMKSLLKETKLESKLEFSLSVRHNTPIEKCTLEMPYEEAVQYQEFKVVKRNPPQLLTVKSMAKYG